MAHSRYGQHDQSYICDTIEDLATLPTGLNIGSTCYVISEATKYIINSKGEWVRQDAPKANKGGSNSQINLANYATKEFVKGEVAVAALSLASKDMLKNCYRPIKYGFTNLPEGAIVDYRDKEVRIYCPADAIYTKQNVGEGGNPNIYYMTFTSYAPEGAVALKEGDRGTVIDELISLDGGTGTGVDKYGRKYKAHWFALASYNEANDTWTYYGANSNDSKYIGWTYDVEWYDANGKVIDMDKIRINLSNANCHLTLQPYYG